MWINEKLILLSKKSYLLMDIVIINPPTPFLSIPKASPNLGLLYLSSYIKNVHPSVSVQVLDLADQYESNYQIPDSCNFYLITSTTPQYYYAKKILEKIKRTNRDSIVIIGGPHATMCSKEVLQDGFDIVVKGEGERAVNEIIKGSFTKGILFRNPIKDLDSLPFPDYDAIDMFAYNYSFNSQKIAQICTTRGCAYGCSFCNIPHLYGTKYRERSIKNVELEILHLKKKYNI